MDARKLEFEDNSFDIVFSLSSIEHFGGHSGSQKSMEEIARVLKPGGITAIVTECILNEKGHPEYFTPLELETFLIKPSGLELVEPIKFDQPSLEPFLKNPIKLPMEASKNPHVVPPGSPPRWPMTRRPALHQLSITVPHSFVSSVRFELRCSHFHFSRISSSRRSTVRMERFISREISSFE